MNNKEFHLPNSTITRSQRRYVQAYRKLAKPFLGVWKEEAKYGYGFDPGILLGSISLTNKQSIALYESLTGKKFTC